MKQLVQVLTTGGTIEKSYSEYDGSMLNRESQLKKRLLKKLRLPHTDIEVQEIMSKDSLHMTEFDRGEIFKAIHEAAQKCNPIVVLHGTDTMANTLSYCFDKKADIGVPVVFTGAMRPAGFEDSDALQNFTEALFASQIVEPGYYLAFHGRLFQAPEVKKNRRRRTFEMI